MNRIFEEERLPPAIPQYKINIGDQCFVPDFAYPDLGIVIEADGNEFHLARQAHERDTDRQNVLILNGWLVLRFTWFMVTRQPKVVADAIRMAIESRATG